jgi:hypothetical protein
MPAEIVDRRLLESTDDLVEHVRLVCVAGHRFLMPTEMLPGPVDPSGQHVAGASRYPAVTTKEHVTNCSYMARVFIWTLAAVRDRAPGRPFLLEGNEPGEKATGAQVIAYFNAHRG